MYYANWLIISLRWCAVIYSSLSTSTNFPMKAILRCPLTVRKHETNVLSSICCTFSVFFSLFLCNQEEDFNLYNLRDSQFYVTTTIISNKRVVESYFISSIPYHSDTINIVKCPWGLRLPMDSSAYTNLHPRRSGESDYNDLHRMYNAWSISPCEHISNINNI